MATRPEEVMLLDRLVRRGDTDLLKPLFTAAAWSDASLSEALSDTFKGVMLKSPDAFLSELANEPQNTRLKVYGLFNPALLSKGDSQRIRNQLKSLQGTSPIASEMLQSVSK